MPATAGSADGVARDADRRPQPLVAVDRPQARTFVPVDELAGLERVPVRERDVDGPSADDDLVTTGVAHGPNGWSLWGDPEP